VPEAEPKTALLIAVPRLASAGEGVQHRPDVAPATTVALDFLLEGEVDMVETGGRLVWRDVLLWRRLRRNDCVNHVSDTYRVKPSGRWAAAML
jgi:hypothetical protein